MKNAIFATSFSDKKKKKINFVAIVSNYIYADYRQK